MIKLGEFQSLIIDKNKDTYAILKENRNDENGIMIPGNELDSGDKEGKKIKVFIYKDTEDCLIATKKEPKITLGEIAVLEAKDTTSIGAFLDWGLDKDLFLPFKEQTRKIEPGKKYPVYLYIDKTDRLCASMRLRNFFSTDHKYKRNDYVEGVVYSIHDIYGAFVAVDKKYDALIDRKDIFGVLEIGDEIQARITKVQTNGKLKLVLKEKAYKAINKDAALILEELRESNGFLPFNDKSDAMAIRGQFYMSKSAFKKALGHLYKRQLITFYKNGIKLK